MKIALPRHLATLQTGLFGTRANTSITVATLLVLWQVLPPLLRWAVFDATFTGNADACTRESACWAFVAAKLRFMLFAFYPPELQWRPTAAWQRAVDRHRHVHHLAIRRLPDQDELATPDRAPRRHATTA